VYVDQHHPHYRDGCRLDWSAPVVLERQLDRPADPTKRPRASRTMVRTVIAGRERHTAEARDVSRPLRNFPMKRIACQRLDVGSSLDCRMERLDGGQSATVFDPSPPTFYLTNWNPARLPPYCIALFVSALPLGTFVVTNPKVWSWTDPSPGAASRRSLCRPVQCNRNRSRLVAKEKRFKQETREENEHVSQDELL
jgi:hypothetical protein